MPKSNANNKEQEIQKMLNELKKNGSPASTSKPKAANSKGNSTALNLAKAKQKSKLQDISQGQSNDLSNEDLMNTMKNAQQDGSIMSDKEYTEKEKNAPNNGGVQPDPNNPDPNYKQLNKTDNTSTKKDKADTRSTKEKELDQLKDSKNKLDENNTPKNTNQIKLLQEWNKMKLKIRKKQLEKAIQQKKKQIELEKRGENGILMIEKLPFFIIKIFFGLINIVTFGLLAFVLIPLMLLAGLAMLFIDIIHKPKEKSKKKRLIIFYKAFFPISGLFIEKIFIKDDNK